MDHNIDPPPRRSAGRDLVTGGALLAMLALGGMLFGSDFAFGTAAPDVRIDVPR